MKILGDRSQSKKKQGIIKPNEVVSRFIEIGKIKMCKYYSRTKLRHQKKHLQQNATVGVPFSLSEVYIALRNPKVNKAAVFDGVYLEFIKHTGPETREGLARFYTDILATAIIPKKFKKAKVITLLKPEKIGTEAIDYRPISSLRILFKILEKHSFWNEYLQSYIDEVIPVEQAGFRNNRGCEKQAWCNSTYVKKVDKQLNSEIRIIISGTVKSTQY